MDMDVTIKDFELSKEKIKDVINHICLIDINDEVKFELQNVLAIREDNDYLGYRVSLNSIFDRIKLVIKIDITTGDVIFPHEKVYKYKLLLDNRYINIKTYTTETVVAEKLDSVLSKNIHNTRLRDYYDLQILIKLDLIDYLFIKDAIVKTFTQRNTSNYLNNYKNILLEIKNNNNMNNLWNLYKSKHNYVKDFEFIEICDTIIYFLEKVFD